MAIEDEFALEIADDVAEKIHSVDDAIKFVTYILSPSKLSITKIL